MIFLVYLLSFIGISIIDALWHLVLFGKQYSQWFAPVARMVDGKLALQLTPGILSQLLLVAATMFLVLYKTGGHPKLYQGALIGAACGILAISVYGLVNYALINNWGLEITILEVLWGPMIGALGGMTIAYLAGKLL
jgi:uncharacterized membrane protein